jgi:hypothetical protein
MSTGLKANLDGSAAIQVGGSDAIQLTTGLAATFVNNVSVTGNLTLTGNPSGIVKAATAVASTSGTSIDFTGIPSTVKRITVMIQSVSTATATNPPLIFQLGTSGGITTSGYLGAGASIVGAGSVNTVINFSNSFQFIQSASAGNSSHGQIIFSNLSGNIWTCNGSLGQSDNNRISWVAGSITLGGVLDRVRMSTASGTDAFDAGTINILYE